MVQPLLWTVVVSQVAVPGLLLKSMIFSPAFPCKVANMLLSACAPKLLLLHRRSSSAEFAERFMTETWFLVKLTLVKAGFLDRSRVLITFSEQLKYSSRLLPPRFRPDNWFAEQVKFSSSARWVMSSSLIRFPSQIK